MAQRSRPRRFHGVAIATSVAIHFSALALFAFSAKSKPAEAPKNEEPPEAITLVELPPPPPEDVPPPDDLAPNDADADASAVAAASLPEPPASLQLASAITQRVDVRPPVPPRPDSLTGTLPVRRGTGGSGSGAGRALANVFSVAQLDRVPTFRVQIPPQYPSELRRQGINGRAVIFFIVDEGGNVIEARASSATHPDFGTAGVEAVLRWKARPGTKDGRPVRFQMEIPLNFNVPAAS